MRKGKKFISKEIIIAISINFSEQETRIQRISDVHTLVYRLPKVNFDMLEIIIRHLKG